MATFKVYRLAYDGEAPDKRASVLVASVAAEGDAYIVGGALTAQVRMAHQVFKGSRLLYHFGTYTVRCPKCGAAYERHEVSPDKPTCEGCGYVLHFSGKWESHEIANCLEPAYV